MNLSIVIPNYNGEYLLQRNLPAVIAAAEFFAAETNNKAEIIIIDDCSEDKSLQLLESGKFKSKTISIRLLKNLRNAGFSSTVNKGVSAAEGEIAVLLNTDVCPEKDFLIPLVQHFNDERVFAVGCIDKSIEKDKTVLRGRGIGSWQRGFLIHSKGENTKCNTLWASGGSSAFRKAAWVKLGGLYTIYDPFYWEDIDLSYRALKAGYKVLFEKASIVIHEHERGVIHTRFKQYKIKAIAYRNQFLFAWINMTDPDLIFAHLLWLPVHLVKAVVRGDFALLAGLKSAVLKIPSVIRCRFATQRFALVSDGKLIKEFKQ